MTEIEIQKAERHIRRAFTVIAQGRDWIGIWELRNMVDIPDLDGVLKALAISHPDYAVTPGANQKALTEEDRAGALWMGGQWKHFLSVRG